MGQHSGHRCVGGEGSRWLQTRVPQMGLGLGLECKQVACLGSVQVRNVMQDSGLWLRPQLPYLPPAMFWGWMPIQPEEVP